MATDTLRTYEDEKLNTVYTQLLIEVLDINDKTPEMRMVLLEIQWDKKLFLNFFFFK